MPTNGIIYIATGQKHREEALRSAQSARQQMPDIDITLFTDEIVQSPYISQSEIIQPDENGLRDKVRYIKHSPYERTLFLDTDTYVCGDLSDLFVLLERFDIGLVHDSGFLTYPLPDVPDSFPQFNSGVICFRKSEKMQQFLDDWLAHYQSNVQVVRGRHNDEPALRATLYHSDLSIAPLTSQYNCRFVDGGFVAAPIKILHSRPTAYQDYASIAATLNQFTGFRVYMAGQVLRRAKTGRFIRRVTARKIGTYHKPLYRIALERLRKYLRREGLAGTVRQILKRLRG